MALYELSDEQVKNLASWIKNITIQANYENRKKFNKAVEEILLALSKPIKPA